MILSIFKKKSLLPLTYFSIYNASIKDEYMNKFNNKQYHEILGIQNSQTIKFNELHRAYLMQIRKYHTDHIHDVDKKRQYQEVTKYINMSFDALRKTEKGQNNWNNFDGENTDVEDQVSMRLFGKKYRQIIHSLYSDGNQSMRKQFLDEIAKSQNKNSPRPSVNRKYNQSQSSGDGTALKGIGFLLLCCFCAIPFMFKSKKQIKQRPQVEVKTISSEQLSRMTQKTIQKGIQKKQNLINYIWKRRPLMLKYPKEKDPPLFQQLTQYSIAPDIHLYEVDPKIFHEQDYLEKNKQFQRYQLTEAKPNTVLTLSLQAERAFQNVYIKVDDIIQQIQQKGSFTPPKVFFKFFGYIMVQIRDKNFALNNYRNLSHISLFDLYFSYYCPIFFKRDYFFKYLVGLQPKDPDNSRYFGHVTLSHRKLQAKYLQKGQKEAILHGAQQFYKSTCSNKNQLILKNGENRYEKTWKNYYRMYESNWKKYCQHQVPN